MTPIVWLCYVRRTWSDGGELPQCLEPTFRDGQPTGNARNKRGHEDCGWYKIEEHKL